MAARAPAPRFIALLAALAGACAGAPVRVAPPVASVAAPAWPAAPEQPRARWLSEFPQPGEAAERASWVRRAWNVLIGAEETAPARAVLTRPFGVAADGAAIVVADPEGARVVRVDWQRRTSEPVACRDRPWRAPSAVAVGTDGTRFVADAGAGVVVRVPRDGPCAALGEGRLARPTGVALAAGRVYVVDPPRHQVVAFSLSDGAEVARFGGLGDGDGRLNFPTAIAAAPDGSLLVVDALHFRVARFSADGGWLGAFGAPGEALGAFVRPKGVAAGPDGRVYVSDAETDLVTVFTADGKPLFALGSPGSGPGDLQMPAGLAVDRDRLFVADALNGRVQVYALLGDPS